jgi:membrane-associated phospholipid phosphatase
MIRGYILKLSCLVWCAILLLVPLSAFSSDANQVTFGGEISDGARRLAGETADLAVTPFEVSNNNIFITLGVAGAVGLLYAFDRQIQDKLTAGQSSTLDRATDTGSAIGNPFLQLGLAAIVYGGGIMADSPEWKETGAMMGEALILADATSLILKEATGRGRPDTTHAKGDFQPFGFRKDYDSLPSMHTSSSFALASVLSSRTENLALKAAYYGTAALVGYSRVYQNKHWASDVVLGAALGELCGRVVTGFHANRSGLALAPALYENGAGLAMVGTW